MTPGSVDHVQITPDRIFVSDNASSLMRGYSRAGVPIFSVPTHRTEQLDNPVQLSAIGDTLLVVDIDQHRGMTVIGPDGRIIRAVPLQVGSSTVGVAPLDGSLAVGTIAENADLATGHGAFVGVVTKHGELIASGCHPDPLYQESVKRTGLYAMFRFVGVSTRDNNIYCRQPVTPVVQIIGQDGRLVQVIREAPPFYRRGPDRPQSMNQPIVEQFRSTWWEHAQFYPVADGFISVYMTFDIGVGETVYRLFACRKTSGRSSCGVKVVPGIPVTFIQPDTLVTTTPLRRATDTRSLAFYTVAVQ